MGPVNVPAGKQEKPGLDGASGATWQGHFVFPCSCHNYPVFSVIYVFIYHLGKKRKPTAPWLCGSRWMPNLYIITIRCGAFGGKYIFVWRSAALRSVEESKMNNKWWRGNCQGTVATTVLILDRHWKLSYISEQLLCLLNRGVCQYVCCCVCLDLCLDMCVLA